MLDWALFKLAKHSCYLCKWWFHQRTSHSSVENLKCLIYGVPDKIMKWLKACSVPSVSTGRKMKREACLTGENGWLIVRPRPSNYWPLGTNVWSAPTWLSFLSGLRHFYNIRSYYMRTTQHHEAWPPFKTEIVGMNMFDYLPHTWSIKDMLDVCFSSLQQEMLG